MRRVLLRRLRWRRGGPIEVAERIGEAERFQRAQVEAARLFELLRLLKLLHRRRRGFGPLAVHREILEPALLQRLLDLLEPGWSDRNRRAGEDHRLVREDLHDTVGRQFARLGLQQRRSDAERVDQTQIQRRADVEPLGFLKVARAAVSDPAIQMPNRLSVG